MDHQLLDSLLATAGEPPAPPNVALVGEDPVFPSPFRTGEAAAAAIGAGALTAARLFEARSGRAQDVRVDVDAAAAGMRSRRYLSVEGPRPPRGAGLAQTARHQTHDGRWFMFQRTFHHHLERQLSVLQCPADEDAIKAAVATWDGLELEDAIVAAGATPGFVRTHAEWDATGQAEALRQMPLFSIEKIGESDAMPLEVADRPLSGIRVLDVTRVLAGPTCGRTLAEHGAEVLRVGTSAFPDDRTMMMDTGHGKRSCELDLKSSGGRDALLALLARADIFSQGYRPGAMAGLGLSPADLAELRPGLVYVSLSAFGGEGPWGERRGFDSVVQSVTGIADELQSERGPGGLSGNPLDYITGYLGAFGAMVGLARRARDGGSYHVRVSLAQSGRWVNEMARLDSDLVAARPPELTDERTAEITSTRETPFGTMHFLSPIAKLSETPTRWDFPAVELDNNPPQWL